MASSAHTIRMSRVGECTTAQLVATSTGRMDAGHVCGAASSTAIFNVNLS